MLVKCVSQRRKGDSGEADGRNRIWFDVVVGRVYLVLGLTFHTRSPLYGAAVTVEVDTGDGHLLSAPLELFDVVNGTPSKFWRLKCWPDGSAALWPDPFYIEYFHDDLSEGVPRTIELYERVRREIEAEQNRQQLTSAL